MLNRDFASATARIAAAHKPTFEARQVPDYGAQFAQTIKNYQDKTNKDALIAALQGGDETAINKAYAAYDPQAAWRQRVNDIAEIRNFERQKELLDIKNQYNVDAAAKNAALAEKIAQIKAGGNGLVNINMNNPFDKKRIEARAKNMDENIAKSQALIDKYKQAEVLLNKDSFNTGSVSELFVPMVTKFNKDAAQFQALVNEIIPTMRPAGSGSASDKDMAIFEKATFGFDKPKEANLNIIRGRMAVEENNKAKEELFADFITNGMGTPADFDRKWRNYLSANPIFGDEEGNTLNKNRVDAYSWFGGQKSSDLDLSDPRIQQALDAGYSMDEINAYLGR